MSKNLSIRDHLQNHYNSLIKYADRNYKQSIMPEYAALQTDFLSKAEAFEAAADLFYSHFSDYIITTTTIRFKDIRNHHLSEEETEPKGSKHENNV